MRYYWCISHF